LCFKNRLKGTDWGELDVLVLDLPPGTGDVQLAVCQDIQLSGAVAVSTPSKLATVDTRKGIDMFTSLGVPTLAVVENMAYFEVLKRAASISFLSTFLTFFELQCEGGTKHYLIEVCHPSALGWQSRQGSSYRPHNNYDATTLRADSTRSAAQLNWHSTLAKNEGVAQAQYGRTDFQKSSFEPTCKPR
jgi:hypothetical protein